LLPDLLALEHFWHTVLSGVVENKFSQQPNSSNNLSSKFQNSSTFSAAITRFV